MIRRKDSFGYIDFLRGKYSPYNINQIQGMIDEMSVSERELLVQLCQGCPDILRQYCSRGGGLNRAFTAP